MIKQILPWNQTMTSRPRRPNTHIWLMQKKAKTKTKAGGETCSVPVAARKGIRMIEQFRLDAQSSTAAPRPGSHQLWCLLRKYPDTSIENLVKGVGEEHKWSEPQQINARRRMAAMELARQHTFSEILRFAPDTDNDDAGSAIRFRRRVLELIHGETPRALDPFDV